MVNVYKCTKCSMLGYGIPARKVCPVCGEEILIKIKDSETENDLFAGEYVTGAEYFENPDKYNLK